MSAGYSITAVVSKLKAREVPAELAYAPVATCFMEYAKDLLGTDGVAMAAHIVAHGMVKGGGLEMEEPCDFRERVEAARAALRYALTLADELREEHARGVGPGAILDDAADLAVEVPVLLRQAEQAGVPVEVDRRPAHQGDNDAYDDAHSRG